MAVRSGLPFTLAHQQHVTNKVENAGIGSSALALDSIHGTVDVLAVGFGDLLLSYVSAVNGKISHDFAERIAQAIQGEVAGMAVA